MTSEQQSLAVLSLLSATLLCFAAPAFGEPASMSAAPKLNVLPHGDFTAARREITGGPWSLGQAWRVAPEKEFRSGMVRFGWRPDALWVLADLCDNHITTRSTGHNQRMWTLGDVFEIFIARARSPFYLELHVTPKNHRLHLRWTNRDFQQVRRKSAPLHDFTAPPGAFDSWVRRTPGGRGWQALVRLPAGLWPDARPFRPGQKLRASFSRYDAGPSGGRTVLSSTSPHRKPAYHRRHEWRTIVLTRSS